MNRLGVTFRHTRTLAPMGEHTPHPVPACANLCTHTHAHTHTRSRSWVNTHTSSCAAPPIHPPIQQHTPHPSPCPSPRTMHHQRRQGAFESGCHDLFALTTPDLGMIHGLTLGHNNKGMGASWYLERASLENVATGAWSSRVNRVGRVSTKGMGVSWHLECANFEDVATGLWVWGTCGQVSQQQGCKRSQC